MAGTDSTRDPVLGGPAIILVKPQMGENIGAVARAMLNFGLTELRIVAPRDGWPNDKAYAMASRADQVLDAARLFDTTEAAIADLTRVYATTARRRDMVKPVMTPHAAAADMRTTLSAGGRAGVLFGGERAGLDNDDVALAAAIVEAPTNPAFSSLNLAQAVLLIAYEWFQTGDDRPPVMLDAGRTAEAVSAADLLIFFERLERELDAGGFLKPPEKRPTMIRNIRNMFQRAGLTDQEVRTLQGIVSALIRRRAD